jgi:hypothetical protein
MKILFLLVVVAISTTQAFGQCACCAGAGIGSANGDFNNGILTLPKKMWLAETYADYRTIQNLHNHNNSQTIQSLHEGHAHENNHKEEEALLENMVITSFGLRYGITDKITISALIPYVFLHTASRNDNGLGDLILMGTFNVYSKNNFNLALQTGIELPSGVQKNSNLDNTTVIVGSGSYDPMFGVSFVKKWDKFMLQGNGLYKQTTKGFQGNYYGSLSVQNLSLSYTISGENKFCSIDSLSKNVKPKLGVNIFGGYYGEWLDKLKENEVVDENSGHYLGFALMGANFYYDKWAFPLTFSLPAINNMNGEQNNAGYRIRLGIIKSF